MVIFLFEKSISYIWNAWNSPCIAADNRRAMTVKSGHEIYPTKNTGSNLVQKYNTMAWCSLHLVCSLLRVTSLSLRATNHVFVISSKKQLTSYRVIDAAPFIWFCMLANCWFFFCKWISSWFYFTLILPESWLLIMICRSEMYCQWHMTI